MTPTKFYNDLNISIGKVEKNRDIRGYGRTDTDGQTLMDMVILKILQRQTDTVKEIEQMLIMSVKMMMMMMMMMMMNIGQVVACLGESVPGAINQIMRILGGITLKVPAEGIPLAPWDKMRAVLLVRQILLLLLLLLFLLSMLLLLLLLLLLLFYC